MRIVFIGASRVSLATARKLLNDDHEVVIIEINKEKIEYLSDSIDCGFILGDGTKPDILHDADPHHTDILFCNTDEDRNNIISTLLAKTLGFERVITMIQDPELEKLCVELKLETVLLSSRMISNYFFGLVYKKRVEDANKLLKYGATLLSFTARGEAKTVDSLKLPKNTSVVWMNRGNKFLVASPEQQIKENDEVVLVTHVENLEKLQKEFYQ